MKNYLENKKGERVGIIRAGMPKEVYFEARIRDLAGDVVLLENDDGEEMALPVDKIIMIGPPEKKDTPDRVMGFKPQP